VQSPKSSRGRATSPLVSPNSTLSRNYAGGHDRIPEQRLSRRPAAGDAYDDEARRGFLRCAGSRGVPDPVFVNIRRSGAQWFYASS
jgi:hypothetical protein